MNIAYTYEVLRVDSGARCMELEFRSPGRSTYRIGARLPLQGENLDAVAAMYAPVPQWAELDAVVTVPEVGATGGYTPPGVEATTLGSAKQAKKYEIANWRYLVETGGITVGGASIRTDRESQSQLSAAYASLSSGLITEVNWKTSDGTFTTLNLAQVEALARAVAEHVQSSFNAEKAYVEMVDACETVEQVQAVQIV